MASETVLKEVVVPKEEAVFWMDRSGHWCNEGGRFSHKRIIDYFNSAIRRDVQGYYLEQIMGDVREKVYFRYEDTPLFVVDAHVDAGITLFLNTGRQFPLQTDLLFIQKDDLYLQQGEERIKFSDRALLKLSSRIDYDPQRSYTIITDKGRVPIPERT